jgi:vitamin B12 transporter
LTREPGDLPGAIVLRSAGVRRTIRVFPRDGSTAARARAVRSRPGVVSVGQAVLGARQVVSEDFVRLNLFPYFPSIASALALAVAPGAASAQTGGPNQASAPDEAGAGAATALPQVVVTANRSPRASDEVGQSVTVLTLGQIQADQEVDVADMVARTPGVSLARNGGPGQPTSLFIRGADSDQTVALIDGVKVNDPTDPGTGYDFANLLTGDISRIEVLRGAQSTLYGSEAIGGVVNIITATPTHPLQGDLRVEGGSYGTTYVKGGLGGKQDNFDWRLGAYYNATDSVSAYSGGAFPDSYHAAGFSGRFDYDVTPTLQLDQRVYYTWSRDEFDGYDTPSGAFGDDAEFGRTQEAVDYTGLNLSLFDGRLKNRFAFEYNSLDHTDEDPQQALTKFTFRANGEADTLDYEGVYALSSHDALVFGASEERSYLSTDSPYYDLAYGERPTKAQAGIASGYAQLTGDVLSNLTLTGGVRIDAHTTFGDHVTGQASAAWRLNDGSTVLRASFGQGFKAPSLYQLYSDYGNLDLKPEAADSWDAGVEQRLFGDKLLLNLAYFGRRTHDLIEFVDCFGLNTPICVRYAAVGGYYQNVAKAAAEGVEFSGVLHLTPRLDLSANYTFDDDENRSASDGPVGGQLPRRPKNTANASLSYDWPDKLTTSVAVRYAGDSFDDNEDAILLKSYTLIDARASYPLREDLELYARIENLTDAHYETAYQYGALGRAGYAGLRLVF